MSIYAKVDTSNSSVKVYPYTLTEFLTENPHNSAPKGSLSEAYAGTMDQLDNPSYEVVEVGLTVIPEITEKQTCETVVGYVDGSLVQIHTVSEKSAEEVAAIDAKTIESRTLATKNKRIQQLSISDWTQLPDCQLTAEEVSDYADYRQQLRDLSTHTNWPVLEDEDWPADPHNKLNSAGTTI